MGNAFDLADNYRMPVIILADGIIGQMMEPVVLPEENNSKPPEKPWAAFGTGGKRRHNILNSLYIQPEELEKTVLDRYARYELIEKTK